MNKKIHLIGICGIAMGTLAQMLSDKGYEVSGSDNNFYPPMSDILDNTGIKLYRDFNEENIGGQGLVIVGNSISRGNVEVEKVLNTNIRYISMAGALYNFFLDGKEVISVSGTHGKSTTSALLSHILETADTSPSFFIGASLIDYNSNYKLGKGRYFVIEGDEYDSAFFEKVPKFIYYRPDHLILTSLEFDHADIYKSIDEIEVWFKRLVNIIPSKGNIVYSGNYKRLKDVVRNSFSKKYSYGTIKSDFNYEAAGYVQELYKCKINSGIYNSLEFKSKIFGDFNCSNIAAAVSMALLLGIDIDSISCGVKSFSGIKRRQELIYEGGDIHIYEDFAHHPTAIKLFLDAMREKYPESNIWAIYEPGSATSRRNYFQNELPGSFKAADEIIFKKPRLTDKIDINERLSMDILSEDFYNLNKNFCNFDNINCIINYVTDNLNTDEMNVIVIMSNRGFDGIYKKIKTAFHIKNY